jgi:hypothetical protein
MMINNETAGCAARQDTGHIKNFFVCQILLAACLIFFAACNGKSTGQSAMKEKTSSDTLSKPKVSIKVNRHYDEKGNVVGFDSTYTSFYSNIVGDTVGMDTLMKGFDRYFDFHHPSIFQKEFSPMFFTDSLRYPDFFHRDFFMKRYELNDQYMRDMMHRMDSIKNRYFEERSKTSEKDKTL